MLMAGVVAMSGHALAVTHLMRAGGRDAWLSGLLALPLALLAVWAFSYLAKLYPGQTVAQYAPRVLGYAGYLVAAFYGLFFFMVIVFTLRMTTDWMVDSILQDTPSWVMGLLYMGAVVYAAAGGLDVLVRANQFLLPLITLMGLLVSFGTMPAKDYRLLLPIFEHGPVEALSATVLALGYFGETCMIAMVSGYVAQSDRKRLFKSYVLALLFLVNVLTGPMAGSTATLGYRVAQNMPYPTFQHWLMLSLARFFERTDLLAVHQWLAGAYVRLCLYLLLTVDVVFAMRGRKEGKSFQWSLVAAGLAAVVVAELAFPGKPFFDLFVGWVYLPAGLVMGIFMPMVMAAVAWARSLRSAGKATSSHGS